MKKLYALAAGLFFTATAFAQNYSVTFQVDLGSATVSSNGVHVAGSFQSWSPSTTSMSQVGTSTVYSYTVSLAGGNYEYKFLNGNAWGDDESIPNECNVGNGNGNRWVTVTSDTTLPAVEFGACAPSGQKAVQFKVDLGTQSSISTNGVHVAGNFQGWDPSKTLMSDYGGDSVYRFIAYVPTSDSLYFKFLNGNSWSDVESVASACQASNNGISQGDNRYYTAAADGIYEVCYNLCASCFIPDTFDVTVNIDLSEVAACGNVDSVSIAGPFNGWSGADLATDPDGDNIYSFTTTQPEGDFTYKARYHDNGNTNWEGGGNKVVTFNSDTTLQERCFGSDAYGACSSVPATADVTFIVDFTQASVTPADTVWLMGPFTQWSANAIALDVHTVAGQYITTVSSFCPAGVEYRFSNGDPNDGANHEPVDSACGVDNGVGSYNRYFLRTGSADTLRHTYGTCSFVGLEDSQLEQIVLHPNPMTSTATVVLGASDVYTVRIVDMTGRVINAFENVNGELVIERGNMVNGLYFIVVTDSNGDARTVKFAVE